MLHYYYRNKLNVKQAINFIAQAWNEVSTTTIANCWKATGILPSLESSVDLERIRQHTEQEIAIDDGETEALFVDLRSEPNTKTFELVNKMQTYCDVVDDPLPTEDIMSDKQIIKMVSAEFSSNPAAPDSEEENEEPPPLSVSISEALNALHTLIQFQEQQEDGKGFNPSELEVLRKKVREFDKLKEAAKQQTNLMQFFNRETSDMSI